MKVNITRVCPVCGKAIKGRSDKRYCSIDCKNHFHYNQRKNTHHIVQEIDQILHKNYKILATLFEGEKSDKLQLPKIVLEKMGFRFNYFTSTYLNSQGKTYHYIYHYAWMEFSTQQVLLRRFKEVQFNKR